MTKFTAIDPNGTVHTRNSKSRTYTHMVVGLPSCLVALRSAISSNFRKLNKSNFYYHKALADGTSKFLTKSGWEDDAQHAARCDREIKQATDFLRGCTTADEYADMQMHRMINVMHKRASDGYYDTYQSLGWCGRADLAHKLKLSSENQNWIGVTIIEVK